MVTYCQEATRPIPAVVLTLRSADTILTTKTNLHGSYFFDLVPSGVYTLTAERASESRDAQTISGIDMIRVAQGAFGIAPLTDPCQLTAADVDQDGEITAGDSDAIGAFLVGVREPDAIGHTGQWHFSSPVSRVDADVVVNLTGVVLGEADLSWPCFNQCASPAPVVLTPTNVARNMVSLAWTESTVQNFFKYELYRNGTLLLESSHRGFVSFNDVSVGSATEYRYHIFVVDQNWTRARSNEVVVMTPYPY